MSMGGIGKPGNCIGRYGDVNFMREQETRGRLIDGEMELKVTSLSCFVGAINYSEFFFGKSKNV